jgi:hypothetical protein
MRIPGRPFRPSPRRPAVLAGPLAAGLVLTVAGCSGGVTPLGPAAPPPRHLGSPIVLQAMRGQPATAAGGCPAGSVTWAALPGEGFSSKPVSPSPAPPAPPTATAGPAVVCYRKLGQPVTITSAAVSPVSVFRPPPPPGGGAVPTQYGVRIALPAAGAAALTAVTTTAFDARGYLDISVSGKTWLVPQVTQPFTNFEIFLASRDQALRFRDLLVPSG